MIVPFRGVHPRIGQGVFVAPGAWVIGDVELADGVSIWFNCTLRGDLELIRIGVDTNIQDGSVVHTDAGLPCIVGDRVVVGHGAIVHGARIGDDALIGMGATVLSGAVVGAGAIVGAGALVPKAWKFRPACWPWACRPASSAPSNRKRRSAFARARRSTPAAAIIIYRNRGWKAPR